MRTIFAIHSLHHLLELPKLFSYIFKLTYCGHQYRRLVDLVPWILQIRDLLVHTINNLEVCLLFALIQAL